MKILNAKIEHKDEFLNIPRLIVLVDTIPKKENMVYMEHDNLYLAELDGLVNSYSYMGVAGPGHEGKEIKIQLEEFDGTVHEKILKGPWAGRASVTNRRFNIQCLDVGITANSFNFDDGMAADGMISLDKAKDAMSCIIGSVLLKIVDKDGHIKYVPVEIGKMYGNFDLTMEYSKID